MLVRIAIPIQEFSTRNYSPNMVAAKRKMLVREYLQESRLHAIMTAYGIDYRVLDSFVFAVMPDEAFVEIKLACNLHMQTSNSNIAPTFKVTYDDSIESEQ